MGIKYNIYNEYLMFKIVAYVCGLMVFLIRDPRCGPSHSDSNSLQPFYLLGSLWKPAPKKKGRKEQS